MVTPERSLSIEGPTDTEIRAHPYALLISRPGGLMGAVTSISMVDGVTVYEWSVVGWVRVGRKHETVVQFSPQLPYLMIEARKISIGILESESPPPEVTPAVTPEDSRGYL